MNSGALLAARFEVVRELGAGGMGVVYEVIDHVRGGRVALKTLPVMNAEGLLRLKHEFRAAADLHHEHLVRLGELHEAEGRWFFTMELVAGIDFLSYVRPGATPVVSVTEEEPIAPASSPTTTGVLDEPRLRAALGQLVDALATLHGAGLTHRDLKPSNVLVSAEGRVVLLDLGLVTDRAQSTQGRVVGTVAYMAPEQAASAPIGPPADLYAVGTMLYEALTGHVPFAGAPLAVLLDKQRREPPHARSIAPGVPEDLDALCAALLSRDPAARPGSSDVRRIVSGRAEEIAAPSASSRTRQADLFVGRGPETARLAAAYEHMRKGGCVALVIEGESGIGKSALARRFIEGVRGKTPEPVILAGRCYERESVPFKAWDGVIDALSRAAERLTAHEAGALRTRHAPALLGSFPVLRRVQALVSSAENAGQIDLEPQERRRRVFAGLRELLGRLAEVRPVVICIDDLQWADADSLALLTEVLRPPDPPALLLVATQRPHAGPAPIAEVLERVVLGPLDQAEAEELTRRVLQGREAGDQVARIARSAAGHPLFIDELARFSQVHGESALDLDQALRVRHGALDPEARRLLEQVALAGVPLTITEARRASEFDAESLDRAIAILRAGRLVRGAVVQGQDAIDPYHDRVREAVVAAITPELALLHHRALAAALEPSETADPQAVGAHWHEAGEPLRALPWIVRAAEACERVSAFDRAAEQFRLASTLAPQEERIALRLRLAEALASAGRSGEAGAEFDSLAGSVRPEERPTLQRRAAAQYLCAYEVDRGLALSRQVLRSLGVWVPASRFVAFLTALTLLAWLRLRGLGWARKPRQTTRSDRRLDACAEIGYGLVTVEPILSQLVLLQGVLLALRTSSKGRSIPFLAMTASMAAIGGNLKLAGHRLQAVASTAREVDTEEARGWLRFSEAYVPIWNGSWQQAAPAIARALSEFERRPPGMAWPSAIIEWGAIVTAFHLGDLTALTRHAFEGVAEGRDRGDRFREWNARSYLASVSRLVRDEPDVVLTDAAEIASTWTPGTTFRFHEYSARFAEVQARLYLAAADEALAQIDGWWPDLLRMFMLQMVPLQRVWAHDLRARCRLAVAATTTAPNLARAAARDARRIRRMPIAFVPATAALLEAQTTVLQEDTASARRSFPEALAAFETRGMLLHGHCTRWRLGELIGGAEGQAMVATAEAYFRNEGVKKPERIVALFAPVPGDWKPRR